MTGLSPVPPFRALNLALSRLVTGHVTGPTLTKPSSLLLCHDVTGLAPQVPPQYPPIFLLILLLLSLPLPPSPLPSGPTRPNSTRLDLIFVPMRKSQRSWA